MESQEEKIPVAINPITQLPEEDPTVAAAIRENCIYITQKGKPRLIIHWRKFMRSRRHYKDVPKNFGLTDAEVQAYMKICNEALVNVKIIGRVWGKHNLDEILQFCALKEIPIYRYPTDNGTYHVFSGDIVRAIESCRLDMKADGAAWQKYILWAEKKKEMDKRRKERARIAKETGIPRPPRRHFTPKESLRPAETGEEPGAVDARR